VDKYTLQQYSYLSKEALDLEEEKSHLADGLIGAVRINDMPKGSSRIHDPMAEVAVKMADLAQLLADKLNEALALRMEIENAIESLEPQERQLIRYRYIDCLSWRRVTERLYGDRYDFIDKLESYLRTVYNHHGNILQKLKDV